MTSPRIAAVLACHNRKAITLACIEALLAQQIDGELTVILVDDGSSDSTAAAVSDRFPAVRIMRTDGQRYWAGAMIVGLQAAMAKSFDFHLWLNDDVSLVPDALKRLLAVYGRECETGGHAPIVIGTTQDKDTGKPSYGGAIKASAWHPFRLTKINAEGNTPCACDTFNGNCVLVPRAAFQRLGSIAPEYDQAQGIGDTDYGLRARRAGIPILVAPGFVGTCGANTAPMPWADGRRPFWDRLASIFGPRGPASRPMRVFVRRHGGALWPLWFAIPILKAFVRATHPPRPEPSDIRLKVALVEGSIPSYRLPFLSVVAARPDLAVTVFHGQAPRYGTDDASPAFSAIRVRNIFWPRSRGRILWTTAVPKVLRGYDVVLIAEHVFNLAHWAVWLHRKLFGRPKLVVTGHLRLNKDQPGSLAALMLPPLRRLLIRGADAVAPYTQEGATFCEKAGVPPERLHVLNNTMDVEAIRAAAAEVSEAEIDAERKRLGIPAGPVFLFVGRLYPQKLVPLTVEAVTLLRAEGIAATLLVVGDGIDRPILEAMAADGAPIRMTGAEHHIRRLAPWFRLSEALVMPDALGLACVHAFASDLPVVTAPGTAHGVEFGYLMPEANGLMAEAMSAGALAAALRRLLQEPGLTRRLRQGARDTADRLEVRYSASRLTDALHYAARDER